jgi:[ribosomal protein S18]-alanine N-acetyltransferase
VPVVIEPLTSPEDIDGILAVEAASFTNPWTREMYLGELANPGVAFFLVARDETRRIVAFCSYWRVAAEVHINNLAVLPEWRRRGLASAMLARVLAEGEGAGATEVLLEVRRSNQAAFDLYRRFAFDVVAIRRGYYSQPPEDALVLRRELKTGA